MQSSFLETGWQNQLNVNAIFFFQSRLSLQPNDHLKNTNHIFKIGWIVFGFYSYVKQNKAKYKQYSSVARLHEPRSMEIET